MLDGDRGMITTARIAALREQNEDPDTATDFGWITALRAPEVAKLARTDGPLHMSLFDQQDLAEITHPDYPGERLIVHRTTRQRARPGTTAWKIKDPHLYGTLNTDKCPLANGWTAELRAELTTGPGQPRSRLRRIRHGTRRRSQ